MTAAIVRTPSFLAPEGTVQDFLQELRRRKVFRVAVIYAIVGWLVIQVAESTFPYLGLPDWTVTFVIGLTALGLPVALVVAWAFEKTPEGVRRASETPAAPGGAGDGDGVAGGVIGEAEPAGAGAAPGPEGAPSPGGAVGGTDSRARLALQALGALAVVAAAVAGSWYLLGSGGSAVGPEEARRSVAVLPFESLSPREEDAYFADGVHEEILTQLAAVDELRVISRTSVMEYRDSPKNVREIARELGVGTVLEGSVRRGGDRIRITAQLIDAATDEHLWAESYDRTLEDVFAIQGEVARAIARALDAELSPEEERRLDRRPTDDTEAYTFYLQGNDYLRETFDEESVRLAAEMYERAVERDPGFAAAWSKLVRARVWLSFSFDAPEELERAKEALERLRALGPDLDATHVAEGWHAYYGERDFERGIREFEIVRRRQPGNVEVLRALSYLQRRTGRWEEHLEILGRALELDPRNATVAYTLAQSLARMRRFEEAEPHLERALSLAPGEYAHHNLGITVAVSGRGDTAAARRVVEKAREYLEGDDLARLEARNARYRRDFEAALRHRLSIADVGIGTHYWTARAARRTGRPDLARARADSVERLAEERLRDARRRGNVGEMALGRYWRGLAYSLQGRHEEAIEEGKEALALYPLDADALDAPFWAGALVFIYVDAGRGAEAVRLLERLLRVPSVVTVHALRLDPIYDPLRDRADFRALPERGADTATAGAETS